MNLFWFIVIVGLVIGALSATNLDTRQKASMRSKRLRDVGMRPDGTLACPICNGTQFTAKRSGLGLMGAGLLAAKTMVRCVTCGTTYKRG